MSLSESYNFLFMFLFSHHYHQYVMVAKYLILSFNRNLANGFHYLFLLSFATKSTTVYFSLLGSILLNFWISCWKYLPLLGPVLHRNTKIYFHYCTSHIYLFSDAHSTPGLPNPIFQASPYIDSRNYLYCNSYSSKIVSFVLAIASSCGS